MWQSAQFEGEEERHAAAGLRRADPVWQVMHFALYQDASRRTLV
jgi:hypothetical protein